MNLINLNISNPEAEDPACGHTKEPQSKEITCKPDINRYVYNQAANTSTDIAKDSRGNVEMNKKHTGTPVTLYMYLYSPVIHSD